MPPASYTGAQYVDSKGCAYIRAGYGGSVTWVPRVTRQRKLICGQTPTFAGVKPPAKTAPAPTQTTTVAAVQTTTVAPAKTKAKPLVWVWPWQIKPKKTKTGTTTVAAVQTKPKVVKKPVVYGRQNNLAVRTVPQVVHPADHLNGRAGGATMVPATQVARAEIVVPAGYKSLLADKTVPAQRGVGTAEGQAAMDLIWTQTMPRRLIDVTTGRDVTAQLPQVRYPYTTVASTKTYSPTTTQTTKPKRKRPVTDEASPINMETIEDVSALYSGQEIEAAPVAQTGLAKQFVQVATFGVPANARRTLAKFADGGIPTASRPLTRGGRTFDIVLLGPFKDQQTREHALSTARGSGFSDAFYVK